MKKNWKLFLLAFTAAASSLCLTVNAVDVPSILSSSCLCEQLCTSESIDGSCPVCRENYHDCKGTVRSPSEAAPGGSSQSGLVIYSFESLAPDVAVQQSEGTDLSSLRFPVSLRGEIRNQGGELESVMIAVTWELDPSGGAAAFQGDVPGEYRFIPLIPSRYSVAGGVALPRITIQVGGGTGTPSASSTASSSSTAANNIAAGVSSGQPSSQGSSPPQVSQASQPQSSQTSQPDRLSGSGPVEFRFEKEAYEAMRGAPTLTAAVTVSGGASLGGSAVLYLDNQEMERKNVTVAGAYPFTVKVQDLLPGKHVLRGEYIPAGERSAAAIVTAELEIKGGAFTVQTMPSAENLTYGQTLSESEISPGTVVDSLGAAVKGEFQWKDPDYMPKTGPSEVYPVVFRPEDSSSGETIEMQVQVGVRPAVLTVTEVSSYGRVYDGSRRLMRCTIGFEGQPEDARDDRVVIVGEVLLGSPVGGGASGDVGRYRAVDLQNLFLAGMNSENYTLEGVAALEDVPLEREIEITPARLTVSVREPVVITMGDPMPELAQEDLSILGLVPGETDSEIDFEEMSTSCTPENSREPGSGTIKAEGLEADNYIIDYVPGELIIEEMVFDGLPYDVEGEKGANGWYTGEITLTPNDSAGRFQFISVNGGRSWDDSVTIDEEGIHELSILMGTAAGRDGVSVEVPAFSYKLDEEAPQLGRMKTNYSEDWTNEDASFTLSCENTPASPVTFYVRVNGGEWSPISGDTYTTASIQTVEFKAVSESGQESPPSQEYEVKIDKAGAGKPSLTGASPNWTAEEAILTVKAPSPMPESGIREFSYSTNGGKRWSDPIEWEEDGQNRFIIDEDGDYTNNILVRIVTNVGSEGESVPYTVKLDSSEPEFSVSAVSDGKPYEEGEPSEQPITFTITPEEGEDIPSGVTYFYSDDDGEQWTALAGNQLAIHPMENAQRTDYAFKAVTGAGVESGEETFRVLLYRPSFTPTRVSGLAGGWSREQVTLSPSGGLPEDQLESYEYCVTETDQKPGEDAEWEAFQRELNVYREMDAYFWFRAVSLCGTKGGESSSPVHLQIDRTAPVIRRESVADITENAAVISLESGESGEVYYLLESGDSTEDGPEAEEIAEGTSMGKIDGQASFPIMGLESGGEYTVSLVVKDRAGNLSRPARLSFVTKPPMPQGVLTEIDYQEETIRFSSQYELNDSPDFPDAGEILSGTISAYIPGPGEPARTLYLRSKAEGDLPASDPMEVTIPPRPENTASVEIDYYGETVSLEPGMLYSFDGEEFEEADGPVSISGRIPEEDERVTLSYRMAATETQFASAIEGINIPARPAAPPAPALKEQGKDSITLDGAENGAYYRCDGGSWQKSMVFQGLAPSTAYTFEAYIPATEQNFSSRESQSSEFATLFALPEEDAAAISFEDETITYDGQKYEVSPDESFEDIIRDGGSISEYIPAAGSGEGTLYIRARGDRETSPSEGEAFSLPARPEPPVIRAAAGLYNIMAVYGDNQEFYLAEAGDSEDIDWDEVRWQDSGSFRGLEAGTEYVLYAQVASGENSFRSERVQARVKTLASVAVQTGGEGEGQGTASVLVNGTPLYAAEPGDILEWRAEGSSQYTPSLSVEGTAGEISGPYREGDVWIWRSTVSDEDQEIEGTVDFGQRKLVSIQPTVKTISLTAGSQANESVSAIQDHLEGTVPVQALYDNGAWEEMYLPYILSEDSEDWEPKGGEYLFSAQSEEDGDISCDVKVIVHPTVAAVDAGGDIFLPVSPEGYSLSDIPLPETARIRYSSGEEEDLDIQWDRPAVPGGFGTREGRLSFIGEIELPEWAVGEAEVSVTVAAVEQEDISQFLTLSIEGWEYGEPAKAPKAEAEQGVPLNDTAFTYTYSGIALDGSPLEDSEEPPEKAGVYTLRAVYQDAEQAGSVTAPLEIKAAPLTVASAELPVKAYDGQSGAEISSIALDGAKNGDDLVLGRDFEAAGIFFEDGQVGSAKAAEGGLVLCLTGRAANYTIEPSFQAVGEIALGEGRDNPAYQSTRAQMEELHIITNRTPTIGDVKLPKGWSFTGDSSEKLLGDSQSEYQTFSFRYTSQDENYGDVTEDISIPVTTVAAGIEGGEIQLLRLEKLGEARRLPRVGVSVLGAQLPGRTPSADDFYWFSRNNLVRVEDAYATPMGDGVGLLELRYEGSAAPAACLLVEINSGNPSKNTMADLLEIAEDINRLLGSASGNLEEEEREFLQSVIQGASKVQGGQTQTLTLEQAELLDEFQQKGLNVTLETLLESVPGTPAPADVSGWGIGAAARAEVNDKVMLAVTPVQPTAGSAMELELALTKNGAPVEGELSSAVFLRMTLPDGISADAIGEIHQAKGERANDWTPIPFRKDGQDITVKLDSLEKIHLLTGGNGGDASFDSVPEAAGETALPAAQADFWDTAASVVREASEGGTVRINAKGFDRMPVSFMDTLGENPQVAVLIHWNGGENILIPAGEGETPESDRAFYPLAWLEERYGSGQAHGRLAAGDVWSVNAPDEADVALTGETVTGKEQGVASSPLTEKEPQDKDPVSEKDLPAGSSAVKTEGKRSAVPLILAGLLAAGLCAVFVIRTIRRR